MKNEVCSNTIAISLHDEKPAPEFSLAEQELIADDILQELIEDWDYAGNLQTLANSVEELIYFIEKVEQAECDYNKISLDLQKILIGRVLRKHEEEIQERLESKAFNE